jgi:Fe2+ or Zn2+ uptake regulation protein
MTSVEHISAYLSDRNLRDTQTRRIVLDALLKVEHSCTPRDIFQHLQKKQNPMNLVTIYRILDMLEKYGVVHKHPCSGTFSLCSQLGKEGHHGLLHCTSCGVVEEFMSEKLCAVEHAIAKSAKFKTSTHVSEMLGMCKQCA